MPGCKQTRQERGSPQERPQRPGITRAGRSAMPYTQRALAAAIAAGAAKTARARNLSAALGWRDQLTNIRLVQSGVIENSPVVAAQRVDALGRVEGGEFVAEIADVVMSMDGGPEAMAARAASRDGSLWWNAYLQKPPTNERAAAGRLAFARRLDPDSGPWRRALVRHIAGSHRGTDSVSVADALWRDTLAEPDRFGAVLYDERLRAIQPNSEALGGEWRAVLDSPVRVETGEAGAVLTALDDGEGMILLQQFTASPGRYRLDVQASGELDGLEWQLQCRGAGAVFRSGTVSGRLALSGRWSRPRRASSRTPASIALLGAELFSRQPDGAADFRDRVALAGMAPAAALRLGLARTLAGLRRENRSRRQGVSERTRLLPRHLEMAEWTTLGRGVDCQHGPHGAGARRHRMQRAFPVRETTTIATPHTNHQADPDRGRRLDRGRGIGPRYSRAAVVARACVTRDVPARTAGPAIRRSKSQRANERTAPECGCRNS